VGRWVDPSAAGVDVREHFGGTDDGVGCDGDAVGFVNDAAERAANVAIALGEQTSGMRVAIDGATVDFEIDSDLVDTFPVDESFVNFLLKLVAADAAMGFMAFPAGQELGRRRGRFRLFLARFLESPRIGPSARSGIRGRRRDFDCCWRRGYVGGWADDVGRLCVGGEDESSRRGSRTVRLARLR
jgi:hypothetical protein